MPRTGRTSRHAAPRHAAAASGDWLTGLHSVREALRARRRPIERLVLRGPEPSREARGLERLASTAGVPVEVVPGSRFAEAIQPEGNDQGVALRAGAIPECSLAELVEAIGERGRTGARRLVALDGVEDPHNVGALARVAESAGVDGLVLTERRAPGLTPAVSRASAGAIEWLPVARVGNLGRALASLQERGFWLVAAAPESGSSLFEVEDRVLSGDLVVVLGAEGRGLRPSILDRADHRVEIPMRGRVDSLNVSTAGAVLLYDLLRRTEREGGP